MRGSTCISTSGGKFVYRVRFKEERKEGNERRKEGVTEENFGYRDISKTILAKFVLRMRQICHISTSCQK